MGRHPKPFTLSLETPLARHVPDYVPDDPRAGSVTVRHVLSHSSGLPNWRTADLPLKTYFPPGERFSYSGEGFVWLQGVVEATAGDPIDVLLHRLVFEPLEMHQSSFVWQSAFDATNADPHDAVLVPDLKKKPTTTNSAASLQTTARDYARFLIEVLSGGRLKPQTARLWLAPHVTLRRRCVQCLAPGMPECDSQVAWGLGWGLEPQSGTFFPTASRSSVPPRLPRIAFTAVTAEDQNRGSSCADDGRPCRWFRALATRLPNRLIA
jgi:CubicO group peptidase (beta-lactamase class C family)